MGCGEQDLGRLLGEERRRDREMGMGLTPSAGGPYSGPPELGAKTAVSLPAGMESEGLRDEESLCI